MVQDEKQIPGNTNSVTSENLDPWCGRLETIQGACKVSSPVPNLKAGFACRARLVWSWPFTFSLERHFILGSCSTIGIVVVRPWKVLLAVRLHHGGARLHHVVSGLDHGMSILHYM